VHVDSDYFIRDSLIEIIEADRDNEDERVADAILLDQFLSFQ
jgi:hypothetical protein